MPRKKQVTTVDDILAPAPKRKYKKRKTTKKAYKKPAVFTTDDTELSKVFVENIELVQANEKLTKKVSLLRELLSLD